MFFRLFWSKVIEEKPLAGRLNLPPLGKGRVKKAVRGDELELFSVKLVLIDELEPNTVQFSSTV